MRTKKMQEGGMPAMNKMAQRKAMTQKQQQVKATPSATRARLTIYAFGST